MQRVVCRNEEANGVDKELSCNVEEDEEEVKDAQPKDHVDLWNTSLFFEVAEKLVLGELQ